MSFPTYEQTIFSSTGVPRGKGRDWFKSVSFLSEVEKIAAVKGVTVLVDCPWSEHASATPYKQVVAYKDKNGRQRFTHKNYEGDFNINEVEASLRAHERELADIDDCARHLESLTSEERQELFTRPYP